MELCEVQCGAGMKQSAMRFQQSSTLPRWRTAIGYRLDRAAPMNPVQFFQHLALAALKVAAHVLLNSVSIVALLYVSRLSRGFPVGRH